MNILIVLDSSRGVSSLSRAIATHRGAIKDTEIRMETLNKRITSLELELARPEVYEGDTSDMLALSEQLIDVKKEIKQEESRWLEKEEALAISKTNDPEHQ